MTEPANQDPQQDLQIHIADTARFPCDTIDGEVILIDSSTGYLFLFTGVGAQIWSCFVHGINVGDLIDEVRSRYGEMAVGPTRSFVAALEEAQMLINQPLDPARSSQDQPIWPETFSIPKMERYDQIADILSMHPIHEVDSNKGWPHRPDGHA